MHEDEIVEASYGVVHGFGGAGGDQRSGGAAKGTPRYTFSFLFESGSVFSKPSTGPASISAKGRPWSCHPPGAGEALVAATSKHKRAVMMTAMVGTGTSVV